MEIRIGDKKVCYEKLVKDIATQVVVLMKKGGTVDAVDGFEDELVTTNEAARMLGISPDRLRHIKDRFGFVKQGGNNQGKLLFRKSGLVGAYLGGLRIKK